MIIDLFSKYNFLNSTFLIQGAVKHSGLFFLPFLFAVMKILEITPPSNSYMYMKDIIWLSITDFLNNKKNDKLFY